MTAEDVAGNRALWDLVSSRFAGAHGRARWTETEIVWGLTATPERHVGALGPVADLRGRLVVDLGCGAGHLSAQLVRAGARAVGVDLSAAQLGAARQAQSEHALGFPLVQADAGHVPLANACADLVVSEHGTAEWCAPEAWLAQAARLLRPAGRLVFLTNSPLSAMCVPADGGPAGVHLLRGPAELRTIRWPGGGLEHHPSHGDWVRLLRAHGFEIEALHELPGSGDDERPGPAERPALATSASDYGIADAAWAARWPVEDLWVARRLPG